MRRIHTSLGSIYFRNRHLYRCMGYWLFCHQKAGFLLLQKFKYCHQQFYRYCNQHYLDYWSFWYLRRRILFDLFLGSLERSSCDILLSSYRTTIKQSPQICVFFCLVSHTFSTWYRTDHFRKFILQWLVILRCLLRFDSNCRNSK